MEEKRIIGSQVREARRALGWTQQKLGDLYGCSHAAISDIERGITKLGVTDIKRLAQILDKDFGFFVRTTSSFQLRHENSVQGDQRKLKEDFLKFVRSQQEDPKIGG